MGNDLKMDIKENRKLIIFSSVNQKGTKESICANTLGNFSNCKHIEYPSGGNAIDPIRRYQISINFIFSGQTSKLFYFYCLNNECGRKKRVGLKDKGIVAYMIIKYCQMSVSQVMCEEKEMMDGWEVETCNWEMTLLRCDTMTLLVRGRGGKWVSYFGAVGEIVRSSLSNSITELGDQIIVNWVCCCLLEIFLRFMGSTNEGYLWVHDQHEKWDTITKEKMQHLDQIIDGHLDWYSTHKTASDIIRTRRALPDLNLAHKRSRKRKLSDIDESTHVTENVFVEEYNTTDKSDQEENNDLENEEECNNNQIPTNEKVDPNQSNMEDALETNNDLDSILQNTDERTDSNDNNPEYTSEFTKSDKVEVVASIRIQPSILNSLDETPKLQTKSSFISRLLKLSKSKLSPQATETNTQVNDNINTTETSQPVVETYNNTLDSQTSNMAESPNPSNDEPDIVVSEIVPEPRHKFQSKKKKIQEKTITQVHEFQENHEVSIVDKSISSTTTNGSNKVIREIDDEEPEQDETTQSKEEDKSKNKGPFVPLWAISPGLEKHLERQLRLDPNRIFGPIKPIKLKDIFPRRVSSASSNQDNV
ncbi:hypothetical protein K501DRAFT_335452 [Backusella circina FSU 941]|nr:hypothetical protein K501DRAFT_335452 [Backusella circina FSU 941]